MSILSEWLRTAKSVFTSPAKHFQQEQRMNGLGYPLKFAVMSLVIAGVLDFLAGVISGVAVPTASLSPIGLATGFLQTIVGGLIVYALIAAVVHVFVYLFGGRGFTKTLAAVEYASVVAPVATAISYLALIGTTAGVTVLGSFVALLALAVGLWALQIEYRAVQYFHGLSSFKAGMSIILPMVLLVLVVIGATAALMSAYTLGPAPPL